MIIQADAHPAPIDSPGLTDSFGRRISYARLSLTDRCDLRCRYCMGERMTFLPRGDLLTFDEIVALADRLIARGIRRIRVTGGEPLVRKGAIDLIRRLGQRLGAGLDELTMTTNGTQLARFAVPLRAAGIRRINVSLDSRDPARFAFITRGGDLSAVLDGIDAALVAGIAVKINMVALAGINEDEVGAMLQWCAGKGMDLTLIETMPLGAVEEDRTAYYVPLDRVRRRLEERWTLTPSAHRTGGPARYCEVAELGARVGFITPLTDNFCEGCNRIRIAATGTVYGCLGHDQKVELRDALRGCGDDALDALLDKLLLGKPRRHDFRIDAAAPSLDRHMNVTGG